jgi:glycosyltransferase involved in cell wall biosynthesis
MKPIISGHEKNLNYPSITEQPWDSDTVPLLSIICTAYNHGSFIKECLDSFIIQETNFPVEILIHDDASTEATAEIIHEYQQRYPQLIRPVLQTVNQFSQGQSPIEALAPMARGRYIARCEGDDYWTDPHKLQIQVDFLERHPEYVVSGHDSFTTDAYGALINGSILAGRHKKDGEAEELILTKKWIHLRTMVYRNVIKEYPWEYRRVNYSDNFLLSLLGHYGKSKYHTDISPACYRRHVGGIWSMIPKHEQQSNALNSFYWMYRYYRRIGQPQYAEYYYNKMQKRAVHLAGTGQLIKETMSRLLPIRTIRQWSRRLKKTWLK